MLLNGDLSIQGSLSHEIFGLSEDIMSVEYAGKT
jgi:hypothetical protein